MRNRGSAIILKDSRVALIKRQIENEIYYVFPGGGIEAGESPEEAAKREVLEELGVNVRINALLMTVQYNGMQFFYNAEIIGGRFGSGLGEEYNDINRGRGTYSPVWVEVGQLSSLDVRPDSVAKRLVCGQ